MSSDDETKAIAAKILTAPSTEYRLNSGTNTALTSPQDLIRGLQTILDQIGTYIYMKDMAGRYTYVNQSVQVLFNTPLENIIGRDDSHFFDLELSNELKLNDCHVIEQGETIEREERTITKSTGETRIYWSVKKPIRNDHGQIIGMCGVSTDITERKQAELALYLLNTRLAFLLSSSPAIIYTCAASSPYVTTFVSANLTKILGYDVKEFLAKPGFWTDHLHPEDRDRIFAELPDLFIHGKQLQEYRFQHRDGSWRWMRDKLYVVSGPDGKAIELIGYFIDITESQQKEAAIAESRNLLKTIIDTVPVRIFWKDKESRFLGCNPPFARDAGMTSPQDVIGKDDYQFGWKEQAACYRNDDWQVITSGISKLDYEERQTTPEGKTIWLRTSKVPLRNTTSETIGILGIYQDITEQKQANEIMRLATTIYQSSSEAILVTNEDNRIIAVNPAFTHVTGYELAEVAGKDPRIFQSGRHSKAFFRKMWQKLFDEDRWQGEIWDRHKDGKLHAKWLNITRIRQSDGRVYCYIAQFTDITEKKKRDELIAIQANYDELTRLPNRNLFKDRLDKHLRKSRRNGLPLALLFLDLDHFKEINDTFGHAAGDKLLKRVAHRIMTCVRETDTVARLGGDEFAVILPDINKSRIESIALHIIQELSKSFSLDQSQVGCYISTSIGIALYPEDGADIESLMKNADQAMYKAKLEGRNRFCYFTLSMQHAANEKMALTQDLSQALSGNELQIHYQPILELASKRIIKAEALLRWQHPHRGMINPSIFIPLAEENGLILEIGEWMFQQSIALIERWRKEFGCIIQISVNISPIQFKLFNTHPWSKYLTQLGLPENCINVEISEDLLLNDTPIVKNRLLEFRNSGMEVSIDDFGTGFSSLSYLKKFDIDYLKIDRSFIHNLTINKTDRALVEAIIVMAHKLDIKTIAEGVETKAQQDLLTNFGCDYAQGFLYSTPIPAEMFRKFIVRQQH